MRYDQCDGCGLIDSNYTIYSFKPRANIFIMCLACVAKHDRDIRRIGVPLYPSTNWSYWESATNVALLRSLFPAAVSGTRVDPPVETDLREPADLMLIGSGKAWKVKYARVEQLIERGYVTCTGAALTKKGIVRAGEA